jgi:excisionase family DNA binding protein
MLTNQDAPTLWTSREAAKALAISPRKLWDLTNRNVIRCVRIGRSVRYDPQDLRTYIDTQKSSNAPAESQAEDT